MDEEQYQKLLKELEEKDALIKELQGRLAEYENKAKKKDNNLLSLFSKKPGSVSRGAYSLGVHLHLYNVNQLDEYIPYLENINFKFDMYISCPEGSELSSVKGLLKPIKKLQYLEVKAVNNRGRDLAPLFVVFGEKISNYDYILHMHGKDGAEIRYNMEVLMGSAEKINYVFDLFETKNAGLIYSDIREESQTPLYSWLQNRSFGVELLEKVGITNLPEVFNYPVDGIFFARKNAIASLFGIDMQVEDFPREQGQMDGTYYHALLRSLSLVAKNAGYDDYILYLGQDDTRKNVSFRPFVSQFKLDRELLSMKLGAYDVVSFDIFNTLLTLDVKDENDIYKSMESEIASKYGKEVDFISIRKNAELKAIEKNGDVTNIDKIYVELSKDKEVGDIAPQIKQLEIDTLYKHCIPRTDMVNVYNSVRNMGKHVILVSDMYLTKAHLVAMLRKCGIGNYSELFIAWEISAKKANASIYDAILSGLNRDRYIHIGDDFFEDAWVLSRRGIANFTTLSPKALLSLALEIIPSDSPMIQNCDWEAIEASLKDYYLKEENR